MNSEQHWVRSVDLSCSQKSGYTFTVGPPYLQFYIHRFHQQWIILYCSTYFLKKYTCKVTLVVPVSTIQRSLINPHTHKQMDIILKQKRKSFQLWQLGWTMRVILSERNQGFLCGSAGKESACNAGDLGLIPGFGRSLGRKTNIMWPHFYMKSKNKTK